EQADDPSGQAAALASLGGVLLTQNDSGGAQQMYERSVEWARRAGNSERQAGSLNQLGLIAFGEGNLINALAYHNQALSIFRQAEHRRGITHALLGLAGVDVVSGEAGNAARSLREAFNTLDTDSGNFPILCLIVTAALAAGRGDDTWAARFLGAASTHIGSGYAPIPKVYRDLADTWEQAVRRTLGSEAFASEWEVGGDLDAEASTGEALNYLGGI